MRMVGICFFYFKLQLTKRDPVNLPRFVLFCVNLVSLAVTPYDSLGTPATLSVQPNTNLFSASGLKLWRSNTSGWISSSDIIFNSTLVIMTSKSLPLCFQWAYLMSRSSQSSTNLLHFWFIVFRSVKQLHFEKQYLWICGYVNSEPKGVHRRVSGCLHQRFRVYAQRCGVYTWEF